MIVEGDQRIGANLRELHGAEVGSEGFRDLNQVVLRLSFVGVEVGKRVVAAAEDEGVVPGEISVIVTSAPPVA